MNRKRLIITSSISIILVTILFIGNSYSIYVSSAPDEEINVYQTGSLDIEVLGNNKTIENLPPISNEENETIEPYRLVVTNKGTVPYEFNLILEDTTTGNTIDSQYIMTRVGKLDIKPLKDCKNNILKEGIIIGANSTISIDVRIWITDKVSNTEINKSFFGRLKIDGKAIQLGKKEIDNSSLENPLKEEITQSTDSEEISPLPDNKEIEE